MCKQMFNKLKYFLLCVVFVVFFQGCIIIHNYKEMSYYNSSFDTLVIKTNGYFINKYNYKFKMESSTDTIYYRIESSDFKLIGDSIAITEYFGFTLYKNGTYYNKGLFYNNSGIKDTLILNPIDTSYSKDLAKQSYGWGCYAISNDTLKVQTFKHHWDSPFPLPAILVWKVVEVRYKILNDSTLQEIEKVYKGKTTPLAGDLYYFMPCTTCKPNPENYITQNMNRRKNFKFRLPLIFKFNKFKN